MERCQARSIIQEIPRHHHHFPGHFNQISSDTDKKLFLGWHLSELQLNELVWDAEFILLTKWRPSRLSLAPYRHEERECLTYSRHLRSWVAVSAWKPVPFECLARRYSDPKDQHWRGYAILVAWSPKSFTLWKPGVHCLLQGQENIIISSPRVLFLSAQLYRNTFNPKVYCFSTLYYADISQLRSLRESPSSNSSSTCCTIPFPWWNFQLWRPP